MRDVTSKWFENEVYFYILERERDGVRDNNIEVA